MSSTATTAPVRVILFGMGTVGRAALRLARTRQWLHPVGAVIGSSASARGRIESGEHPADLRWSTDADLLLDQLRPEVALIATRSPVTDVKEDIIRCVERGVSVVTSSEEMFYPNVADPAAAGEIEAACRAGGAAVVATGINPG